MNLKNKVILITGASNGIGKATAEAFAEKRAKLVITYNTDKESAENLYSVCKEKTDCLLVHLDVSNTESIQYALENAIKKFTTIDILINNAGVITWKPFSEQTLTEIADQVDINLLGLMHMTRLAIPHLARDGIIITIASEAGKTAYAGLVPYCATKFAVRGFTQALAKELSTQRVYCVNPGMTATKMTEYQGIKPEKVADVILKTAQETLDKKSGDDIDVRDYH